MVDYLKACIESAIAGGNSISTFRQRGVRCKGDPNVGDHAVVGSADFRSQRAVLKTILGLDNTSYFLTEESVPRNLRSRCIGEEDLQRLSRADCYMIDELDGSSSFQVGHYEWSVSVSFVRELEFLAGAVYAPKILNGTLFYASRGRGAFERSGKRGKRLKVGESKLKDAYIVFGVDCFLEKYPIYNRLLKKLGNPARTTNGVGSCALGLGLVAAGRIDALIQPPQSPWDYSAGKVLVEEAGGRFFFTRS